MLTTAGRRAAIAELQRAKSSVAKEASEEERARVARELEELQAQRAALAEEEGRIAAEKEELERLNQRRREDLERLRAELDAARERAAAASQLAAACGRAIGNQPRRCRSLATSGNLAATATRSRPPPAGPLQRTGLGPGPAGPDSFGVAGDVGQQLTSEGLGKLCRAPERPPHDGVQNHGA